MSLNVYKSFYELLPFPALVIEPDEPHFTIAEANNSFQDLTGSEPKHIQGKSLFDVFTANLQEKDAKNMLASLTKVLQTGEEDILDVHCYSVKNKSTGKVEDQYYEPKNIPVLSDSGKVECIIHVLSNVTIQVIQKNEIIKSENRFKNLVQTIDGIFWEANADDFNFTYVSPQSINILGYKPDEWVGVPGFWSKKIHPDDRKNAVEYCHNQTRQRKNHTFEYRMQKADGSYVWIRDVVTVHSENEKPAALRGLMLDITERKELELQLQQAYEIAKIGNWSVDLVNQKFTWSENVREIYEVEPDYTPDIETVITYFIAEDREKIMQAGNEAIKNNKTFDTELKVTTARGNEKWIRIVGKPEFKDGNCVKIIGSSQDITKRKQAQLLFEETEQKLRNVVECSTNMFYTHDTGGVLSYVSPQSISFLGYEPEEAIRNWTDYVTDHPENEKGIINTIRAIETGKAQPPYDLQLRRKDGKIIWAEVNEAPLLENGKTAAIVGSLTDITDRKNFEEQLISVNKKLASAQKISKVGSWEIDIALNNKLYWSDITRRIFGVDDKFEPDLDKELAFYEPESREIFRDAVRLAITSGKPFDLELLITTQNGTKQWIRCIAEAEFENKKPRKIIGSIQDIHDHKSSELELKNRNDFIEKTLDNLPIGIAAHTIDDGKITLMNRQFNEIYGWLQDDLSSVDEFFNKVYPEVNFRKQIKKQILDDIQSGDPDRMVWNNIEITTQTGEKRIINAKNIPLFDQNLMISTVVDITKEKYAEKELVRILESISDAFYAIDANWNFTYFNREAENLLKKSSKEVIGRNIWEVFTPARDTLQFEKFHESVDNNQSITFEYYYPPLATWFEISTYPNENGLSVFFRDINERKESEEQLLKLNRELEKHARELAISNTELEQFAYVASHDLQEPLRMVSSFLTQLDKKYKDQLDDKAIQYINFAVDGAKRMRQIILDLLNYSRVGRQQYTKKEICLDRLLKEILVIEQTAIKETNGKVTWDKLPEITGAEIPLQQLFQNLITNALKYHKQGTPPEIRISSTENTDFWQFTISDNGIGIDEQFQDNIFTIFQRLHTQHEYAGTGIGLAVARKITENHGGKIWVESKEGEGSTFHFTIKKPE